MWTEVKNRSRTVSSSSSSNSPKMAEPHLLTRQLLHAVQQRNGSTAAATSHSEDSVAKTSGLIPAAIAATLFIAFILALYTVLWRCMVSPPQRKHSRVRMRGQPRASV